MFTVFTVFTMFTKKMNERNNKKVQETIRIGSCQGNYDLVGKLHSLIMIVII